MKLLWTSKSQACIHLSHPEFQWSTNQCSRGFSFTTFILCMKWLIYSVLHCLLNARLVSVSQLPLSVRSVECKTWPITCFVIEICKTNGPKCVLRMPEPLERVPYEKWWKPTSALFEELIWWLAFLGIMVSSFDVLSCLIIVQERLIYLFLTLL